MSTPHHQLSDSSMMFWSRLIWMSILISLFTFIVSILISPCSPKRVMFFKESDVLQRDWCSSKSAMFSKECGVFQREWCSSKRAMFSKESDVLQTEWCSPKSAMFSKEGDFLCITSYNISETTFLRSCRPEHCSKPYSNCIENHKVPED